MTKSIADLAAAARPINDDDWGTDRQITAENTLFERVRELISREAYDSLTDWCLKATTNEMIDEALVAVAAQEQRDAYRAKHAARRAKVA